jgi:hypothetical protein
VKKDDVTRDIARNVERAGIYQVMRMLPWQLKLLATVAALAYLYWAAN